MKVISSVVLLMTLGIAYCIRLSDIPDNLLKKKTVSLTVPYKTYIQTLNPDAVSDILNKKITVSFLEIS